jgi:3-oxoacyl-[acyl-carrier protein] reductase
MQQATRAHCECENSAALLGRRCLDLGLAGKRAIVCASSRGLGKACAFSLAREGSSVVINGLDANHLEVAAHEIRTATGAMVTAVQADITTDDGRKSLLAACEDPNILVTNNAGPPPGKLADWDHSAWIEAIEANRLAAVLLIRAVVPARKFGRIVNVTSAMVKSPRPPTMGLSTAARAGLTAFSKSLSLEVAVDNVTINNLLPERIDTNRQRFMAERMMKAENISYQQARRQNCQHHCR